MSTSKLNALQRACNFIHSLSDAAWGELSQLAHIQHVAEGQHILRAGETARNIYFLNQGLLREYYIDANGKESTRRFSTVGHFSGSLADLLAGGPAAVSIEALQASELISLDWQKVDALAEVHPSLMKLLRRMAEHLYVRKMRREYEMLTMSAAQRYRQFIDEEPALQVQLPQHLLASYLGITPVHLSRICVAEKHKTDPAKPGRKI